MLDKIIMFLGLLGILMMFVIGGALVNGYVDYQDSLQTIAQFIASDAGKFGGYRVEAEEVLQNFIDEHNRDASKVVLDINADAGNAPVPYGTTIRTELTDQYHFKVGSLIDFTVPVHAQGRSVCSYLGGYNVSYTTP
ncbi:hypothetical protein [Desulfotomaculum nigrificans]|uniref:hypothetical protein n=1 Tax=Desulfotomaculum nigrificans TaxID=1565 RepID=UPI0001FAE596|nr:hypothetical protein [Desulfotomaculum nigrificans]